MKRYSRAPVGFGLRDQDIGHEAAAVVNGVSNAAVDVADVHWSFCLFLLDKQRWS